MEHDRFLSIRLDEALRQKLDAYRQSLEETLPGLAFSVTVRRLLEAGLDALLKAKEA